MNTRYMAIAIMVAVGLGSTACTKRNIKTADGMIDNELPVAQSSGKEDSINNAMAQYSTNKNNQHQAQANQQVSKPVVEKPVQPAPVEYSSYSNHTPEAVLPQETKAAPQYNQPQAPTVASTTTNQSNYYQYNQQPASASTSSSSSSTSSHSVSSSSSSTTASNNYYDYGRQNSASNPAPSYSSNTYSSNSGSSRQQNYGNQKGYVIQLIASSLSGKAESIKSEFASEGYKAFVNDSMIGGRQLYRVQLGPYASKSQAEGELNRMKRRYLSNPHVNAAFVNRNA